MRYTESGFLVFLGRKESRVRRAGFGLGWLVAGRGSGPWLLLVCLCVWFAGWRYRGPVDQDNSYDYGGGGRLGLVAVCNLVLICTDWLTKMDGHGRRVKSGFVVSMGDWLGAREPGSLPVCRVRQDAVGRRVHGRLDDGWDEVPAAAPIRVIWPAGSAEHPNVQRRKGRGGETWPDTRVRQACGHNRRSVFIIKPGREETECRFGNLPVDAFPSQGRAARPEQRASTRWAC